MRYRHFPIINLYYTSAALGVNLRFLLYKSPPCWPSPPIHMVQAVATCDRRHPLSTDSVPGGGFGVGVSLAIVYTYSPVTTAEMVVLILATTPDHLKLTLTTINISTVYKKNKISWQYNSSQIPNLSQFDYSNFQLNQMYVKSMDEVPTYVRQNVRQNVALWLFER